MARPPELWAFVLANTAVFLVSSVLVTLSYLAYRQSDRQSTFLQAAIGFGFVVLGGLVEPAYQLGVRGDYNVSGTELLWLQAGEGVLIAIGLAILFVAITRHNTEPALPEDGTVAWADRSRSEFGSQQSDD